MRLPLFCFLAFLIGSFPTAYVIAKKFKRIDIRQHGSGNVGATNAVRVLGKRLGGLVFAIDFVKGALPVWLFLATGNYLHRDTSLMVGAAAILGHIFTPFLRFKGGKGIAAGSGVLFASYPSIFIATILGWIIVFKITRIVSLSSILSMCVMIAAAVYWQIEKTALLFFIIITLTLIWTHRSNIQRLFQNKENKF